MQRLEIDTIFLVQEIDDGETVIDIVLDYLLGWVNFYPILSLVLFAVCCFASASSLNSIQQEMNRMSSIKMSPSLALNYLRKWKRCHAMVRSTVTAIDYCFGPSLFLSVPLILIKFINLFVKEFSECLCFKLDILSIAHYSAFVEFLLALSLVCFPIDYLRFKVVYTSF